MPVDASEVDADATEEAEPAGRAEPTRAQLSVAARRLELLDCGLHVGPQRLSLLRQRLDSAMPGLLYYVILGEVEGPAPARGVWAGHIAANGHAAQFAAANTALRDFFAGCPGTTCPAAQQM